MMILKTNDNVITAPLYCDVIMSTVASEINSLTIVCLFCHLFRHTSNKKIKAPRHWPVCAKCDRWILTRQHYFRNQKLWYEIWNFGDFLSPFAFQVLIWWWFAIAWGYDKENKYNTNSIIHLYESNLPRNCHFSYRHYYISIKSLLRINYFKTELFSMKQNTIRIVLMWN